MQNHYFNPSSDKPALRRFAKGFRKQLPLEKISQQICAQIRTWPRYQQARTILAYSALPFEITLNSLFDDTHKTWLLPRVVTDGDKRYLRFFHYKKGNSLETSSFGVQEPLLNAKILEKDKPIDLILVPGLMFDQGGQRLGYGLSFYDRFLHERFGTQKPDTCLLVGIVADALYVPTLPSDPWDVPTDWIITEKGRYEVLKR